MEIQENQVESWSETESTGSRSTGVGFSGPLSGPLVSNKTKNSSKKSARFKDEEELVEITLDVRDDGVSVQNIRGGDSETALLATRLEKRPSFSVRLRQVSQELKRMTSSKKFDRVDRTKSGAARALKGLKFMTNKNVGTEGWSQVEKRFDELAVDGKLPKTRFGQCIGMYYFYYLLYIICSNYYAFSFRIWSIAIACGKRFPKCGWRALHDKVPHND